MIILNYISTFRFASNHSHSWVMPKSRRDDTQPCVCHFQPLMILIPWLFVEIALPQEAGGRFQQDEKQSNLFSRLEINFFYSIIFAMHHSDGIDGNCQ